MLLPSNVKYIIADPSEVLSKQEYLLFLFELAGRNEMTVSGHKIVAFKALSGSGEYPTNDSNGGMFKVSASLVAALPVEICSQEKMDNPEHKYSFVYCESDRPISCSNINGLISFGRFQVNTDENNLAGAAFWPDQDEECVEQGLDYSKVSTYQNLNTVDFDDIPF